jgi:hypothetical protein
MVVSEPVLDLRKGLPWPCPGRSAISGSTSAHSSSLISRGGGEGAGQGVEANVRPMPRAAARTPGIYGRTADAELPRTTPEPGAPRRMAPGSACRLAGTQPSPTTAITSGRLITMRIAPSTSQESPERIVFVIGTTPEP